MGRGFLDELESQRRSGGCVGVSLDLQNDGADVTLTDKLLLKFTVLSWNKI